MGFALLAAADGAGGKAAAVGHECMLVGKHMGLI